MLATREALEVVLVRESMGPPFEKGKGALRFASLELPAIDLVFGFFRFTFAVVSHLKLPQDRFEIDTGSGPDGLSNF